MWGAASILFWCAAVRRPQAWSARCSGALVWARPSAATPAGAGGWGRWGARCAGPAASPPPPRCGPFWGRGGAPSAQVGRRVAPVAPKLGGGSGGAAPPPPRPVGRGLAIRCLRRAPPGYTRAVGVAGQPRASGAVRSAANGSVRRGGGGEGGGNPPARVCAPFSGPASERAAPFAPSWAPPVRRRPAAGRACGRLPRPWCPRIPGAAASSGGVRGRRFFGLPPSALGPEWEGGAGWGGPSGPLAPPPDGRGGGGMAVPAPGASHRLGGRTLPPPPST